MDRQALLNYYAGLLIIQYAQKTKAVADTQLGCSIYTGDFLIGDIDGAFDIDTAVGKQLDLIGKIVGLNRIAYGFDFALKYFSLDDYDNAMDDPEGYGFSDVDAPTEAIFKDYEVTRHSVYAMTDFQYRKMLKLKIVLNNGVSTDKQFDSILYEVFGTGITVTDNLDMTGTITVQHEYKLEGKLIEFLKLFPKPLGVEMTINYL